MRKLRVLAIGAGVVGLACAGGAGAAADAPSAEAVRLGLLQGLARLGGGTIDPAAAALRVTRERQAYRLEMPVQGAGEPVRATLRPTVGGAWDVLSATLPPSGRLDGLQASPLGPAPLDYALEEQSIRGRVDPTLRTPSAGDATLRGIGLSQEAADARATQHIDGLRAHAEATPESRGSVDLHAQVAATNLRQASRDDIAVEATDRVAAVDSDLVVLGIDPGRLPGLVGQLRRLASAADWRARAADVLDALPGALNRFALTGRFDDAAFALAGGQRGEVKRIALATAGNLDRARLDGHLSMTMDGLRIGSVPPELAAFVPRHAAMTQVFAGLPVASLSALLRRSAAAGDDAGVREQAVALLRSPGAKVAVESLLFDAGPLRVRVSARLAPEPGEQLAVAIHVAATGLDALLSEVRSNPGLLSVAPGILLARAMAHADGDGLAWDMTLDDGGLSVNGVPLGKGVLGGN